MIDVYLPLYKAAVTRIKSEFPDLRVGGPQGVGLNHSKQFIEFCAREKLPIDFYGFTVYVRDPETVVSLVRRLRRQLDENGFAKTEIVLAEWHFGPIDWGGHGTVNSQRYTKAWRADLNGTLSAVYTAALLMRMQDEPVSRMYYYSMKTGSWGLFDAVGGPTGSYWAMYAFAQLARGDVRVETPLKPRPQWWVLASRETKTPVGHILVATMRTDNPRIALTLKGCVEPVSVRAVDPIRDCEETSDWKWDAKSGKLTLHRNLGDSAIWLVETRL